MSYAPILTAAQIERIRAFAKPRQVAAGKILYEPNDDTPPVYVVISGEIKTLAVGGGEDRTVTTYNSGQFSGELLMSSGRRSIYRCQVVQAGTLLELAAKDLRTLIGKDAELSDVFMKAFLARRLSLRDAGQGNVVILDSRYSASTLAIREFLRRDGHPFTYLDLDADQMTQELRDRFGVGISPETAWPSGCVPVDSKRFVLTGRDLEKVVPPIAWPLSRAPFMLETSLPGVSVVGDARSGNVKRVASAGGEGSIVVHLVHQVLAEP